MKSYLSISLFFLGFTFFNNMTNTAVTILNPMVGSWEYEVPDAPYEYQKGELNIAQTEDKLTAELVAAGYANKAEDLKTENKNLKFHLYIEGTKVSFDLDFEEKSFSGRVTYSEGTITIKGKKKE